MKYRLQYVNRETGYTTIQIYPNILTTLEAVKQLMHEASHEYRITITTKS